MKQLKTIQDVTEYRAAEDRKLYSAEHNEIIGV